MDEKAGEAIVFTLIRGCKMLQQDIKNKNISTISEENSDKILRMSAAEEKEKEKRKAASKVQSKDGIRVYHKKDDKTEYLVSEAYYKKYKKNLIKIK